MNQRRSVGRIRTHHYRSRGVMGDTNSSDATVFLLCHCGSPGEDTIGEDLAIPSLPWPCLSASLSSRECTELSGSSSALPNSVAGSSW